MDWVVNCAAMSQFYLSYYAYREARHCLACATCMEKLLPKDSTTLQGGAQGGDTPEDVHANEVANISRCWVKFFASLLTTRAGICRKACWLRRR